MVGTEGLSGSEVDLWDLDCCHSIDLQKGVGAKQQNSGRGLEQYNNLVFKQGKKVCKVTAVRYLFVFVCWHRGEAIWSPEKKRATYSGELLTPRTAVKNEIIKYECFRGLKGGLYPGEDSFFSILCGSHWPVHLCLKLKSFWSESVWKTTEITA